MVAHDGLEALERFERTASGGVEIAYRAEGTGLPVVFLHGTSANLGVWDPIVAALRGRARTIALDQRGHGRSDAPIGAYAADDYVSDLLTVRRHLGLGRMLLVGHSLGARNAWVFAARHPDATAGVIAIDYTPFVETEVLDTLADRVAAGDRLFESVEEIERYLAGRYAKVPAAALARRARYGYGPAGAGFRPHAEAAALDATVRGLRIDYSDEYAAVAAPMTVIRGEASLIVSPVAWQKAKALAPGFRYVDAIGADHYVPEEQPDLIVSEIRRFLNH